MKAVLRVNDGSKHAPKLDIQQSWWAMIGLGNGEREWTIEEKFEKIAEAGFTGILGFLPPPHEEELWHRLLEQYQFSFGIHSFPAVRSDLTSILKAAKAFGVQYINSQVTHSFVTGEQAQVLLAELIEEAANEQIPYFIETHRGRITQDLIRTVEYVNALPNLRLTIDLSHYIVAGEMLSESEQAESCFAQLLMRTSSLHARVSNGEQIQVDIGNGQHSMLESYKRWWEQGIRCWLKEAQPGDVLPFVTELGPPPYSITTFKNERFVEISDRWEQALVLKQIIEEVWQKANLRS
jgi:hypothetical protein